MTTHGALHGLEGMDDLFEVDLATWRFVEQVARETPK